MDLDGDGHQDILSGSWPGELFFFRGGPDGAFAAPVMLQDEEGAYINIGGGIEESEDRILITGNADFETTDEGAFVVYHGKRIRSTDDKPVYVTGTASAVHACDWDGDGDLDLLVGDIRGSVYLIPNLGNAKEWSFGRERNVSAGGRALVVAGDAGPFTADWDGDGDLDLLIGDDDGAVSLCRNTGTRTEPRLAKPEILVPPVERTGETPTEPTRGSRAKICVADWNGDGRLDLLLGDYAELKPDLPEPTAEERAAHEGIRAELEKVRERYGELANRVYGPGREKDSERRKELAAELKEVSAKYQELSGKLPRESESHGWVWLFLRRADASGTGSNGH